MHFMQNKWINIKSVVRLVNNCTQMTNSLKCLISSATDNIMWVQSFIYPWLLQNYIFIIIFSSTNTSRNNNIISIFVVSCNYGGMECFTNFKWTKCSGNWFMVPFFMSQFAEHKNFANFPSVFILKNRCIHMQFDGKTFGLSLLNRFA
jgi:hypothetical protein